MQPTLPPAVLVILGVWNHMIFSREWIKSNLYADEDVIIDDPVAPNSSVVFGTESYKIFIQENRLNFIAIEESPEVYGIIEKKAIEILTKLKHTPLSAFGLNFAFNFNYNANLNSIRPITDQAYFKAQGYFEDLTLLHRTFTKDNYQLTVAINLMPYEVKVELNTNYQVNDSSLFLNLFKPGILQSKRIEVTQLIQAHYQK